MTTQAKQALRFFAFFAIFFANSTAYAAPRLPENLAKTASSIVPAYRAFRLILKKRISARI